ncbi:YciI family protein [Christensenellaceae bacterium OttesenSCG-928-K19]|nr:YciI family protein [Christensenellaceae bacterium OttesenSCG-928-K19]
MKFYVLEGSFVENHPTGEAFKKALDAHHEYMDVGLKDGSVLISGPKVGAKGGVIVVKTDDIVGFCNNDPFVKEGVQEYRVSEFSMFDCQDFVEGWFKK